MFSLPLVAGILGRGDESVQQPSPDSLAAPSRVHIHGMLDGVAVSNVASPPSIPAR
jgi:hypothetical protein